LIDSHDSREHKEIIVQVSVVDIQRHPLRLPAVDHYMLIYIYSVLAIYFCFIMCNQSTIYAPTEQQRDDDPGAQRRHEQVERLRGRAHLEGRLRVEELQRRDGREDLGDADQHELRNLNNQSK
jgi:hypothetical protein